MTKTNCCVCCKPIHDKRNSIRCEWLLHHPRVCSGCIREIVSYLTYYAVSMANNPSRCAEKQGRESNAPT